MNRSTPESGLASSRARVEEIERGIAELPQSGLGLFQARDGFIAAQGANL